MRSQVTTKRGDRGRTVTLSGDEYSKAHPLLECCGDLDTLRAETALYRLELLKSGEDDAAELGAFLFWLLHVYFLDVGQGDATLLRTPGGAFVLIDGGRDPRVTLSLVDAVLLGRSNAASSSTASSSSAPMSTLAICTADSKRARRTRPGRWCFRTPTV